MLLVELGHAFRGRKPRKKFRRHDVGRKALQRIGCDSREQACHREAHGVWRSHCRGLRLSRQRVRPNSGARLLLLLVCVVPAIIHIVRTDRYPIAPTHSLSLLFNHLLRGRQGWPGGRSGEGWERKEVHLFES